MPALSVRITDKLRENHKSNLRQELKEVTDSILGREFAILFLRKIKNNFERSF